MVAGRVLAKTADAAAVVLRSPILHTFPPTHNHHSRASFSLFASSLGSFYVSATSTSADQRTIRAAEPRLGYQSPSLEESVLQSNGSHACCVPSCTQHGRRLDDRQGYRTEDDGQGCRIEMAGRAIGQNMCCSCMFLHC